MKIIKIKRKAGKGKHITNYTNGNINLQFKGKGPFEIQENHFPLIQDFFEVQNSPVPNNKEKKDAISRS